MSLPWDDIKREAAIMRQLGQDLRANFDRLGLDPDDLLAMPRPRCAVCRRPVERVTTQRDMLAGETITVVECHGAREESRVRDVEIQGAERILMGEAFAGKAPALPVAAPEAEIQHTIACDNTGGELCDCADYPPELSR